MFEEQRHVATIGVWEEGGVPQTILLGFYVIITCKNHKIRQFKQVCRF